jgi:uncharacterized membrane protein
MSLYTAVRHPRVHLRHHAKPAQLSDEHVGVNGRIAAWITGKIGSMWTVYACVAITAAWMLLGSHQLLGFDPYPYPFFLFLGNVVQLLLIFIILLGQQVLGRSADKRALQTYEDAEAILEDCEQIQNHLIAQDNHLADCISLDAGEKEVIARAAERLERPPTMADQYTGFNGRLAAWITNKVGTMTAFYLATILQLGWIALAQAGIIRFDPYPFSFLLFLSSLTQLLLMFVIMVGQQVIGKTADQRALQTYLDAEAVLHACERLQAHLRAQDLAIRHIVEHMNECRPQPVAHAAANAETAPEARRNPDDDSSLRAT